MKSVRLTAFAAAFAGLLLAAPSAQAFLLLMLLNHLATTGDDRSRLAELDGRQDWVGLVRLADQRLAETERERDASWLGIKGYGLRQAGRCDEAVVALELALQARPEFSGALDLIGQCHMEAGRHEQAIASYGALLRRDPGSLQARANLVRAHARRGEGSLAVGHLEQLRLRHKALAASLEEAEIWPLAAHLRERWRAARQGPPRT